MPLRPRRVVAPDKRRALFFALRPVDRFFAFLMSVLFFLKPCVELIWRAKWAGILKDLSHLLHLSTFRGIANLLPRTE